MADAYDYLERQVDDAAGNNATIAPQADDEPPADDHRESRRHRSSREHKSSRDKSRSRSRERRRGSRSEKSSKHEDSRRDSGRTGDRHHRDEERRGGRDDERRGGGGGGDDRRFGGRDEPRPPMQQRQPFKKRERTPPEAGGLSNTEKDLREMERSARTVFAYNLSLKAEDRDIFQLFSRAGTVLDVKLITDRSTRRSKGFAYIEYESQDGVLAALGLTGQLLMGQPVMVKSAEAEKNLAWEVQQNATQAAANQQAAANSLLGLFDDGSAASSRLLVSNLNLALDEADLKEVFQSFGALESVMLVRGTDGKPIGQAFIQYTTPASATLALKDMDGLKVAGSNIEVKAAPALVMPGGFPLLGAGAIGGLPPPPGIIPTLQLPPSLLNGAGLALPGMPGFGGMPMLQPSAGAAFATATALSNAAGVASGLADGYSGSIGDLDEDEGGGSGRGGLKMNATARAALMSRLATSAGLAPPPVAAPPQPYPVSAAVGLPGPPRVDPNLTMLQGLLGPASPIPTPCLLLKNMFTAAEESGAEWELEIASDVREECGKHGPISHVWVDKNSQGFVYLKFVHIASAEAAQRSLHGRYFAGRQIAAEYQFEAAYNHLFKC